MSRHKLQEVAFKVLLLRGSGDAERIEWPAWEVVPGLVVHRAVERDYADNPEQRLGWRVSHRHSGRTLFANLPGGATVSTRAAAVRQALAVANVTDWTRSMTALVGTKAKCTRLGNRVRKAYDSLRAPTTHEETPK